MEITLKLNKDFERCLENLKVKYGEDFEFINGIHPSQLDNSEFLDHFVSNNTLADVSIDPNANANRRDIRSFITEKGKSTDKLFALNKIFYEIKKRWGIKAARQWLEQEFSKGFYLNDATTASYFPYCYAVDLSRLAREGLFFLSGYNNQPPKHLTTYFDDVIEFISFLSNRQSGAVGLPNVLIWAWYFWGKDCENDYYLKDPDTYLRQNFQKFIYRLNQPFLRINQCAFTNVSIFDRPYLENLFGGIIFPDGTLAIEHIEDFINVQKVFMEVVSETRHTSMFTFPVLTYSLLRKKDIPQEKLDEMIKTKNWDLFVDNDFARWCSNHNILWSDSNFFVSDNVGTLSNCCFGKDQEFYYYDKEGNKYLTTIGDYVEKRLKRNYQSSQVIDAVEDEFIDAPNGGKCQIKAVSKLPNKYQKLVEIELEDGRKFKVTPDQRFFDNNSNTLVTASQILSSPEKFDI